MGKTDYTGWGCGENGRAYVASTLADLWRWGLTDEQRERIGDIA